MNFPDELLYTKSHEWLRKLGDNTAHIGITDYAQDALGDIVFVDFKITEGEVLKGDSFCELESVKAVESSYMPVSGRILEINSKLENDYGLINTSPYEKGWLIKIQILDPSQLTEMIRSKQYTEFVTELDE